MNLCRRPGFTARDLLPLKITALRQPGPRSLCPALCPPQADGCLLSGHLCSEAGATPNLFPTDYVLVPLCVSTLESQACLQVAVRSVSSGRSYLGPSSSCSYLTVGHAFNDQFLSLCPQHSS